MNTDIAITSKQVIVNRFLENTFPSVNWQYSGWPMCLDLYKTEEIKQSLNNFATYNHHSAVKTNVESC